MKCPYKFAKNYKEDPEIEAKDTSSTKFYYFSGTNGEMNNYHENPEKWSPYNFEDNRKVINLHSSWTNDSKPKVSYELNQTYDINFTYMVQYRKDDKNCQRYIRRAVCSWFWKDDNKCWIPYSKDITEILEREFSFRKSSITLKINGVQYKVDFTQRCQFRESNSNLRRDIKREGPDLRYINILRISTGQWLDCRFVYPDYWSHFDDKIECLLVPLDPNSKEFLDISNMMNKCIYKLGHDNKFGLVPYYERDPTGFEVTGIQRVQCKELWTWYISKKIEISQSDKQNSAFSQYIKNTEQIMMPNLDKSANEFRFFHGTNSNVVDIIRRDGFDSRESKNSGMFGVGIYFAQNSSKSNQYVPCPHCDNGSIGKEACECTDINMEYKMILSRVCLGNPYLCLEYSKNKKLLYSNGIPKEGCHLKDDRFPHHSVFAECHEYSDMIKLKMREFIVYERSQTYPEYIINYKRLFNPTIDTEREKQKLEQKVIESRKSNMRERND